MMKIVCAGFLSSLMALSALAGDGGMAIDDKTFGCVRNMKPVRGFFVDNLLGNVGDTVAVATAGTGTYPPGSVVQLVPGEVMVKRAPGTSPVTSDWEFFELEVSADGGAIKSRGFVDVVNRFGGNCFACHVKANPGRDLICETGNGCDPIPLTPTLIKAIQNTDPRCEPVELPPEQVEALKQMKAALAGSAAAP